MCKTLVLPRDDRRSPERMLPGRSKPFSLGSSLRRFPVCNVDLRHTQDPALCDAGTPAECTTECARPFMELYSKVCISNSKVGGYRIVNRTPWPRRFESEFIIRCMHAQRLMNVSGLFWGSSYDLAVQCPDQASSFAAFYEVCTGNTLCEENYYVHRHKCKKCKGASTSPAGLDPAGPDSPKCVRGDAGGGH